MMRLSVADIGHVAVSSPSVALGGLSCAAEQQPAQRERGWRWCLLCSSPPPLHPSTPFFFSPQPDLRQECAHVQRSGGSETLPPPPPSPHGNVHPSQSQRVTLWHMWTRIIVTSSDLHQQSRPPGSQAATQAHAGIISQ